MRILIYRTGSLGDTLIALPCFRAIRAKFSTAHICLLTNSPINNKAPRMIDILTGNVIDEVLEYNLKSGTCSAIFLLLRTLRNRKFDLAIHLVAARGWGISLRDFIFLKLAGAKQVIGIPFSTRDLYPREIKKGLWEWEAERLARRIYPLVKVNISDPINWDLTITPEEKTAALSLLARKEYPKQRWIAASVGTKTYVNDWMEKNWLELLQSLQHDFTEIGLIMIGCESDFERSERCLNQWLGPRLNLCGKISPRISAAVLKETELFIGHDSGPMHLAAVVGTPCVVVFSARNFPGQWFPKGEDRNRIFYLRTECFGCGLEFCTDHAKKCILSITVKEVQEAVQRVLQKSPINYSLRHLLTK